MKYLLYMRDALKENRLGVGPSSISHGANGPRPLILPPHQHPIQPFMSKSLQEPLDVGARQLPHCIKAQGRVFGDGGSIELLGGQPAFLLGDALDRAL